jgi:hypothetical protein
MRLEGENIVDGSRRCAEGDASLMKKQEASRILYGASNTSEAYKPSLM